MTSVGEKLRKIMLEKDLSPKEIAAKINRSRRTVYNFFEGKAGPRTEAQIVKVFPNLHTFAQ